MFTLPVPYETTTSSHRLFCDTIRLLFADKLTTYGVISKEARALGKPGLNQVIKHMVETDIYDTEHMLIDVSGGMIFWHQDLFNQHWERLAFGYEDPATRFRVITLTTYSEWKGLSLA